MLFKKWVDQRGEMSLQPREIMAHHAKSFYWASQFLSPVTFDRVASLYSFCRHIDDAVDRNSLEEGQRQLTQIGAEMQGLEVPRAEVRALLDLMVETKIPVEWPLQLWLGAESDLTGVDIQTEADLLVYSYRVAGVVGLMMCPLLGVYDRRAWPFAIDLGIAMQLTNICRDVGEDAEIGRNYLPAEWWQLSAGRYPTVADLVPRAVNLAEIYYESGRQGYPFIPWRERLAIAVAARVYRGIGLKVLKDPGQVMSKRVYLTKWEKIYWTLVGLKDFFVSLRQSGVGQARAHQQHLHKTLRNLPGVVEDKPVGVQL